MMHRQQSSTSSSSSSGLDIDNNIDDEFDDHKDLSHKSHAYHCIICNCHVTILNTSGEEPICPKCRSWVVEKRTKHSKKSISTHDAITQQKNKSKRVQYPWNPKTFRLFEFSKSNDNSGGNIKQNGGFLGNLTSDPTSLSDMELCWIGTNILGNFGDNKDTLNVILTAMNGNNNNATREAQTKLGLLINSDFFDYINDANPNKNNNLSIHPSVEGYLIKLTWNEVLIQHRNKVKFNIDYNNNVNINVDVNNINDVNGDNGDNGDNQNSGDGNGDGSDAGTNGSNGSDANDVDETLWDICPICQMSFNPNKNKIDIENESVKVTENENDDKCEDKDKNKDKKENGKVKQTANLQLENSDDEDDDDDQLLSDMYDQFYQNLKDVHAHNNTVDTKNKKENVNVNNTDCDTSLEQKNGSININTKTNKDKDKDKDKHWCRMKISAKKEVDNLYENDYFEDSNLIFGDSDININGNINVGNYNYNYNYNNKNTCNVNINNLKLTKDIINNGIVNKSNNSNNNDSNNNKNSDINEHIDYSLSGTMININENRQTNINIINRNMNTNHDTFETIYNKYNYDKNEIRNNYDKNENVNDDEDDDDIVLNWDQHARAKEKAKEREKEKEKIKFQNQKFLENSHNDTNRNSNAYDNDDDGDDKNENEQKIKGNEVNDNVDNDNINVNGNNDESDLMIRLPCSHLFHSECIMIWLKNHNTCPLCRWQLPTSDPKYEMKRRLQTYQNNNNIFQVDS